MATVPRVLAGGHPGWEVARPRQHWPQRPQDRVRDGAQGGLRQGHKGSEWSHIIFPANRATATSGRCAESRPGLPPHPPTVVSRPQSCACHRARTVHLLREHPGGNLCDPGLGRDLLRNNPQKTVQKKKKNELDLTKTFKTMLFKKILLREAKDKPQTGESLIKYSYLSMQITLTPQQEEENPR